MSNLPSQPDNPQSNNNKQEGPSDSNYACIKAQDKTRTEYIRTWTQSLLRKVKIQELTNLRDYFWSSSEGSTQLSSLDRALPELLLLNQNLYCEGGFYRGEWDLHQLGEVGFSPGGGRAAKPRGQSAGWSGLHRLSPPTRASPPRVDAWQPRLGPNHLKPWLISQGVWLTSQPLGPHSLGLARLVHVPITPPW
jgi:hypothetical protein